MTGPWERSAGKYDRPSSTPPKPDPLPAGGSVEPDEPRDRYRGVEPIGSDDADVVIVVEDAVEAVEGEEVVPALGGPASASGERLRGIITEIDKIEAQRQRLNDWKKDVLASAKAWGFDMPGLREVIRRRKLSPRERADRDDIVGIYESALEACPAGTIDGGVLSAAPAIAAPAAARSKDAGRLNAWLKGGAL